MQKVKVKKIIINFKNGFTKEFTCLNYTVGVALLTLDYRLYKISLCLSDISSFLIEPGERSQFHL